MNDVVPVFSKNFDELIHSCNYEVKEAYDYFEEVKDVEKGHYLKTSPTYGKSKVLIFDRNIRDIPEINKYLYKGTDFARNYLIDNGFFVPDEDKYNASKQNFRYYKYRRYTPANTEYRYIAKEDIFKAVEEVNSLDNVPERIKKNWNVLKNQCRTEENGTTFHQYIDNKYVNDYLIPTMNDIVKKGETSLATKISGFILKNKIRPFVIILFGLIASITLSIINYSRSDYYVQVYFQTGKIPVSNYILDYLGKGIIILAIAIVFIGLLLRFIGKKIDARNSDKKAQQEKEDLQNSRNELFRIRDKYFFNVKPFEDLSNDIEEAVNLDNPDKRFILYENANYNLERENIIFNMLMYFGYPYTFSNGETFQPVYATKHQNFILGFDQNYKMVDDYLNYMEEFVYPMIRQHCRNGEEKLYNLNSYVINELRTQMRHQEIMEKVDGIKQQLEELNRINRSLLDSMNSIDIGIGTIGSKIDNFYYDVNFQLSNIQTEIVKNNKTEFI